MTHNYDTEARLRAIAMNSIREAMLVYNRWDRPFTDDDAARMHDVFLLLHLQDQGSDYEHAPLVAEKQSPVSAAVHKVADLLGDESFRGNEESTRRLAEAAPVKVSLPKAVQKPER